ncbi:glycosyltransferase family 2 protein [Pedobacter psychrodurus]|uniref:Glycosyltransferase family 2 protein n=1 Tax=Pedobacter psychrodurus TaxID=2530456 RepID=A0A4R0PQB0_9SPHI|nr:glycosyltransferase family 2 protein [Pedobacter psychrodurus]TCD23395.1 glycosyltransferase family 2 protein [Pedobacter psychrodurus]
MAKTSIITVNYNQPGVTLDLLKSIKENCSLDQIEVILIDNASEVDNENLFSACYAAIKYIRSEVNLGFAGGNNLGIQHATGEYILMINNDTELIPGFIEQLIAEMLIHPEIGILSPLILYHDDPDIIQYAGYTPINFITGRNQTIGFGHLNKDQYANISHQTAFCHGAAMMCRKTDVDRIGLMPEQYFLYYEELDWCEMFKRAGKKIWFSGKTHILHKESMSVGKESPIKTYFITRNRMLFMRRNTSWINVMLFSTYYLLLAIPKQLIGYMLKGRSDLIPSVLKALKWNIFHSKNHLGGSASIIS